MGMDMTLVKNIIQVIVKPLTYICNQSFQTGIFPNSMKTAKVIPIYKNGDRHLFTNYRPISLLPQFSKIIEKLFVHRLDNFIEKHNLLCDQQYGFRANRSTSIRAGNRSRFPGSIRFRFMRSRFDSIHDSIRYRFIYILLDCHFK